VNSLLKHLNVTYTNYGLDKLPKEGRYLFVSNHPLGGFDGVILMSAIGKKYPNVKFVVNDLLMYLRQLRPLFLPVNHHGKQSSSYYKSLQDAYNSDDQILYFPAGLCSRKIKGVITDLPWKKSIIKIAKNHKRDIIPVLFDGRNSNFFYNLSNFRTVLGIKANLEMLYLSDELFRQRNMHFNLYMGEPISYQFLENGSVTEMLSFVRNSVYALSPNTKNRI
jgi:putative hemolysin